MIVRLGIPRGIERAIATSDRLAGGFVLAVGDALHTAAVVGAHDVTEQFQTGQLGLTPQHGAEGMAGDVTGWLDDPTAPRAAIGIQAGKPSLAYARIHEFGGTILPKKAAHLAVPISDEARKYSSPRDMADLTYIPRPGKPPLLVRILRAMGSRRQQWQIHWVLLSSVTLPARRWLSNGVRNAVPAIREAFRGKLWQNIREMRGGSA